MQKRHSVIVFLQGGDSMPISARRATVYLDPVIHKALKLKAVETDRSVSELINEAVRQSLMEDAEDLASFEERVSEPLVSYEEMVKRLKADGRL
jgi:hypothetical protein